MATERIITPCIIQLISSQMPRLAKWEGNTAGFLFLVHGGTSYTPTPGFPARAAHKPDAYESHFTTKITPLDTSFEIIMHTWVFKT